VLLATATSTAAGGETAAPAARSRPSAWAYRSRVQSPLPPPGPSSWRTSTLPC
jgi:hypothetical protein